MAHLVLSSDDCRRYCSLPLSSPRYDYQIGSCRNDLHPGPFDLCRLSARTANSTCSWKKNQRDSQSLWLDLNLHRALEEFSENSKCYQHRAQRGRPSSSFLTDWVTAQKRRKPGRYTTHPRVAFLFKQLSLLSSFTSLVKHSCPTSWRLYMRRIIWWFVDFCIASTCQSDEPIPPSAMWCLSVFLWTVFCWTSNPFSQSDAIIKLQCIQSLIFSLPMSRCSLLQYIPIALYCALIYRCALNSLHWIVPWYIAVQSEHRMETEEMHLKCRPSNWSEIAAHTVLSAALSCVQGIEWEEAN